MSMRKNHRAGAAVKRNSVHNRCGGCQKYVIQEQGGPKVKWRGEACFGSRLLSEGKKFQHVDMQLHVYWILFSPSNGGIALLFEYLFAMYSHFKSQLSRFVIYSNNKRGACVCREQE